MQDDRIDAIAERHPALLQLEYYRGEMRAWTAPADEHHDPADPTTWTADHWDSLELVPDAALAADLRELLVELGPASDPIVWHRPAAVESTDS